MFHDNVCLRDGSQVPITFNDDDEWLEYVYTSGQCVAYAVALAEYFKLSDVYIIFHHKALRHAYAFDSREGLLYDIHGEHDVDLERESLSGDLGDSYERIFKVGDVADTIEDLGFNVHQNYGAARKVVARKKPVR